MASSFFGGLASDYDEWERQGARGWSYGDVLPFFRRMEASSVGKDEDHGRDGPITITTNKRPSDTAKAFVASCENLQYSRNTDFNSGRIDGVGFVPINVDGRWRHSTASAYLRPNLNRPNLKLPQADDGPQDPLRRESAPSAWRQFRRAGRCGSEPARRSCFRAEPSIRRPCCCRRESGRPTNCRRFRSTSSITCPGVGKNLQDHLNVGLSYRTNVTDSLNLALNSRWKSAKLMADWFFTKSGPIAGGATEATLFARTDPALPVPDLQFQLMNFSRDPTSGQALS